MEKLLDSVMDIGEQMLISGAEVHRVEDSIKRIFDAYGTKRTDVFIITSSIVVTIHTDDKAYTQTRRIKIIYFSIPVTLHSKVTGILHLNENLTQILQNSSSRLYIGAV